MKRSILTVMFCLALAFGAAAQNARSLRVKFPRGRTTAILSGRLRGEQITRYILAARAGQTLIAHVTSPTGQARFDVYRAGDRNAFPDAEDVADWTGELSASGNYVVSVYGLKPSTRYTLEITIR
jgi:hypothetical protein